jgi:hypothetical protein
VKPRGTGWVATPVLLALAVATASAAEGPPYLLKEGTWVCVTPAAYDQAMVEQGKTNGYKELMALKDRLLADKSCMFVDDEDIEDMMAPFVQVGERQDNKIKVTFTIEFYNRVSTIAAAFNRVRFTGWTAEDRLADYRPVEG